MPNNQSNKENTCPLCNERGIDYCTVGERHYLRCTNCCAIFLHQYQLPEPEKEMQRYMKHKNDVNDDGYRNFVSPIINSILKHHQTSHKGLDYGSGVSSAVTAILLEKGYSIAQYDPFFLKHAGLLAHRYDYVVCCEVIEHFHNPAKEFELLKRLLKEGSRLYCMTHLYEDAIDFKGWYYKNDFTHVFFYHKNSMEWIKEYYKFSDFEVNDRLITFTN